MVAAVGWVESSESQDPTNHVDGGTRFTAFAHSRTTEHDLHMPTSCGYNLLCVCSSNVIILPIASPHAYRRLGTTPVISTAAMDWPTDVDKELFSSVGAVHSPRLPMGTKRSKVIEAGVGLDRQ